MEPAILIQRGINELKIRNADAIFNISEQVKSICCFGGDNHPEPKKLGRLLNDLLGRINELKLCYYNNHNYLQPLFTSKTSWDVGAEFTKIDQTQQIYGIPLEKWDDHFHTSQAHQRFYVNPTALKKILIAISGELDATHPLYNIKKEIKEHSKEDFQKIIATMTMNWAIWVKSPKERQKASTPQSMNTWNKYLIENKTEPQDPKERELVLQFMVSNIIWECSYFGTGNCGLMAELALCLAIQTLDNNSIIRYIRFTNKDDKNCEEVNGIVIGPWPNQGCIILAPWYNDGNPIQWQENFANTPELKQFNNENILFTIKDAKEKEICSNIITKAGFNLDGLLKNKNRDNYIKYIKERSEETFKALNGSKKIQPKTLQN